MSVYNMSGDSIRKHMIICRVQISYLSILCGKALTECGGQWITIADLQRTRELLKTGNGVTCFYFCTTFWWVFCGLSEILSNGF